MGERGRTGKRIAIGWRCLGNEGLLVLGRIRHIRPLKHVDYRRRGLMLLAAFAGLLIFNGQAPGADEPQADKPKADEECGKDPKCPPRKTKTAKCCSDSMPLPEAKLSQVWRFRNVLH